MASPQSSNQPSLAARLDEAAQVLREAIGPLAPVIGITLGSGLGPLATRLDDAVGVPYGSIPHMRRSTAPGHAGRFVCGRLDGIPVLAMQGRLHPYEGYEAHEVAFPIWLMARCGIRSVILTSAVGAVNQSFAPGDFCVVRDHLAMYAENPARGPETAELGERFFSMTDAYDPALRRLMHEVATSLRIPVREGVYGYMRGPSFETPAEIAALGILGADLVGMSLVQETIAARQVSMNVLAMTLVTNMAAGIQGASPTGEEVINTANDRSEDFCRLITTFVRRLSLR